MTPAARWALGGLDTQQPITEVYFDKPGERDVPQVAAAFCELEDIAFFRTGEGTALLCRYRGESRKTREGMD